MVRGAWVRGRRLDGPPGLADPRGRPAHRGRHDRRRDRSARSAGSHGGDRGTACAIPPGDVRRSPPRRTIDATGLVVAPGFIDLHSHGGLVILAEPRHEPKVRQGVTTELIGVDGNAYAPFPSHDDLLDFAVLNGGLDGRPDIAFDWSTVAEYLARYDGAASRQHRLPRRQLRRCGSRPSAGTRSRRTSGPSPTSARGCARRWRTGAFGLSTGPRLPAGRLRHDRRAGRARRGEREARRLLPHATCATRSATASSTRSARRSRSGARGRVARPHHPLLPPGDVPGPAGADARAGRRRAGRGPRRHLRPVPLRVGEHAAADHAADVDPGGRRRAAQGAPGRRGDARADPRRARRPVAGCSPATGRGTRAPRRLRPARAPRWEGRTLGDVMRETGTRRRRRDLRPAARRGPAGQPGDARARTSTAIRPFLAHPQAMVGTDWRAHRRTSPSPRTYGSFPRILGEFVREERLLGLEEAVRKMTGVPAARLGLPTAAVLADGLAADLVVFDPATVRTPATYDEPRQFPVGIPYVIVNGTSVVDERRAHRGPRRAARSGADGPEPWTTSCCAAARPSSSLTVALVPAAILWAVLTARRSRTRSVARAAFSAGVDVGLLLSIALICVVGLRPGRGLPGGFEQWNLVPFRRPGARHRRATVGPRSRRWPASPSTSPSSFRGACSSPCGSRGPGGGASSP